MKAVSKSFVFILCILFFFHVSYLKAQDKALKIISYNILEGMKLDTTEDKSSFVSWVKSMDPDILALQEVQKLTQGSLQEMALKYGHPYAILLKEDGYPVALTSKMPIINVEKVVDNMHHGFISAEIDGYNLLVIHFSPHQYRKRREEADLIISTIRSKPDDRKWIIMGDFNAVSPEDVNAYADGKFLERMKRKAKKQDQDNLVDGKLDYTVIQKFLDAGFIDVYRLKNPEFNSTLPTAIFKEKNGPKAVPRRIDFIFISPNIRDEVIQSEIIKDAFTGYHSDHYPVLLKLK